MVVVLALLQASSLESPDVRSGQAGLLAGCVVGAVAGLSTVRFSLSRRGF